MDPGFESSSGNLDCLGDHRQESKSTLSSEDRLKHGNVIGLIPIYWLYLIPFRLEMRGSWIVVSGPCKTAVMCMSGWLRRLPSGFPLKI